MAETLNAAQLEILKLLKFETTAEELFELKKVITKFLADRLTKEVVAGIKQNGYTSEQTDLWANEHIRTPYK